jgi:hypothetical protein
VKLEYVIAGLFLLIGVVTAIRSLRSPVAGENARARWLIALHEAARSLFWLSLGGAFLLYGLLPELVSIRFVALVTIGFAGLRLMTAVLLVRR